MTRLLMPASVTVVRHPLLQDALARLRDRRTAPAKFRKLMEDAGVVLGLAALDKLKLRGVRVETSAWVTRVDPRRVRLEWVSASEGARFAKVVTDMVAELKRLGPSPYKM